MAVLYTVTSERLKPNPDHSPRAVGAAKRLRHPASDNCRGTALSVDRSTFDKAWDIRQGAETRVGLEWFPPFPKYFFI